MSTAAAALTVDEFLQLPPQDGVKRELIEGVVCEMPHAAMGHEIVKSTFLELLIPAALRSGVSRVFSETLFVLDPETSVVPDVALVARDRLRNLDLSKNFPGAPDLAVEVVSSETAGHLETKVRAYLRTGSKLVWTAYIGQRGVRVHRPDGTSVWLEKDQVLEGGDLLPGFQTPVSRVFEGI